MHRDLHNKNILLTKTPDRSYNHRLNRQRWTTSGWLARICDFGHSRIQLANGEIIYNTEDPFSEAFDASKDIIDLATCLCKIKIDYSELDEDEEITEKKLISDIKRRLKRGESAATLIGHDLFEDLKGGKPIKSPAPFTKSHVKTPRVSNADEEDVEKENFPDENIGRRRSSRRIKATVLFTPEKKVEKAKKAKISEEPLSPSRDESPTPIRRTRKPLAPLKKTRKAL